MIHYMERKIQNNTTTNNNKKFKRSFSAKTNREVLCIASELIVVFWHAIFPEVLEVVRQAIVKEDGTL